MKVEDVIAHFGTATAAAKALGVTKGAVSQWATSGQIPALRQYQIERVTGGALRAADPGKPGQAA